MEDTRLALQMQQAAAKNAELGAENMRFIFKNECNGSCRAGFV